MTELTFDCAGKERTVAIDTLVIAGWTGRDTAALQHHIDELKDLGIAPPTTVPLYYRVAAQMLTTADRIQVLGTASSGEVEPVLVVLDDGLWVGVGSDHTDREVEAYSIAVSKQMASKVIGPSLWPMSDVADHWDQLLLRADINIGKETVPYQKGPAGAIRDPDELMRGFRAGGLAPGTVMFMGTFAAIGGIRPSSRFAMTLEDPVRGRKLTHTYTVESLPMVS